MVNSQMVWMWMGHNQMSGKFYNKLLHFKSRFYVNSCRLDSHLIRYKFEVWVDILYDIVSQTGVCYTQ